MKKWKWIDHQAILAIHDVQLAEHGGSPGVRDRGLLKSTLARPLNLNMYELADVAAVAACYAAGIIRNHPFIDGNKRTGFVALELFLVLNGYELTASDMECVMSMLAVAEDDISEAGLADWIRLHLERC